MVGKHEMSAAYRARVILSHLPADAKQVNIERRRGRWRLRYRIAGAGELTSKRPALLLDVNPEVSDAIARELESLLSERRSCRRKYCRLRRDITALRRRFRDALAGVREKWLGRFTVGRRVRVRLKKAFGYAAMLGPDRLSWLVRSIVAAPGGNLTILDDSPLSVDTTAIMEQGPHDSPRVHTPDRRSLHADFPVPAEYLRSRTGLEAELATWLVVAGCPQERVLRQQARWLVAPSAPVEALGVLWPALVAPVAKIHLNGRWGSLGQKMLSPSKQCHGGVRHTNLSQSQERMARIRTTCDDILKALDRMEDLRRQLDVCSRSDDAESR